MQDEEFPAVFRKFTYVNLEELAIQRKRTLQREESSRKNYIKSASNGSQLMQKIKPGNTLLNNNSGNKTVINQKQINYSNTSRINKVNSLIYTSNVNEKDKDKLSSIASDVHKIIKNNSGGGVVSGNGILDNNKKLNQNFSASARSMSNRIESGRDNQAKLDNENINFSKKEIIGIRNKIINPEADYSTNINYKQKSSLVPDRVDINLENNNQHVKLNENILNKSQNRLGSIGARITSGTKKNLDKLSSSKLDSAIYNKRESSNYKERKIIGAASSLIFEDKLSKSQIKVSGGSTVNLRESSNNIRAERERETSQMAYKIINANPSNVNNMAKNNSMLNFNSGQSGGQQNPSYSKSYLPKSILSGIDQSKYTSKLPDIETKLEKIKKMTSNSNGGDYMKAKSSLGGSTNNFSSSIGPSSQVYIINKNPTKVLINNNASNTPSSTIKVNSHLPSSAKKIINLGSTLGSARSKNDSYQYLTYREGKK